MPQEKLGGNELRVGSAGVPLAVAPELYRRLVINGERPRKVWGDLELSEEVGRRMGALLRRHGLPSTKRLILLSIGYPERTYAEIAAAFRTSVDVVSEIARLGSSIRAAEPLSTELWEDIKEKDVHTAELAARAADVRSTWRGNGLDKGPVSERPGFRPQSGEGVGGAAARPWARYSSRGEARPAGPQSSEGLLPHAGRGGRSGPGDKGPRADVYQP